MYEAKIPRIHNLSHLGIKKTEIPFKMKTKNIFPVLSLLFIGCMQSTAQITSTYAIETARRFIASSQKFTNTRRCISQISLKASEIEETGFLIVNISENNGFVLIDPDGNVCGYSDKGYFDPSVLPSGILSATNNQQKHLSITNEESYCYNGVYGKYKSVAPLLTSRWGQDWPYNSQCPIVNSDIQTNARFCAAGCVPLALGQIMRFHKYPEQYSWDSMLDSYNAGMTAEDAYDVAMMLHDVGKKVEAEYGFQTSASNYNALIALKEYGYSPAMRLIHGSIYSRPAIEAIILGELIESRPVYIGGNGHAFVCDGNDSNGFLHINWGWNGMSDGYYSISVLAPQSQGTGGTASCYNTEGVIIGIAKAKDTDKVHATEELLAASFSHAEGNRFILSGAKYELSYGFGGHFDNYICGDCLLDNKQIGVNIKNIASGEESIVSAEHANSSQEITIELPTLEDGDYKLIPVYRTGNDDEWEILWSLTGNTAVINLNVTNGQLAYENYTTGTPDIRIDSFDANADMIYGLKLDMDISASKGSINNAIVNASFYDETGEMIAIAEFPSNACIDVPAGMNRTFSLFANIIPESLKIPENALLDVTIGDIPVIQKQSVKIKSYAFPVSEDTKLMCAFKKSGIDANNDGLVSDNEIIRLKELTLDDPGIRSLAEINIPFPKLFTLNISNCDELEYIDIKEFSTKISSFGLDNCSNIKSVDLSACSNFYSMGFANCPNLKELNMPSETINIHTFTLFNTGFKSVDLSSFINLLHLAIYGNSSLTTLKLPLKLKYFHLDNLSICQNPQLTSLDLSAFSTLNAIYVNDNALESLVLPDDCSALTYIEAANNRLSKLELSKVSNLRVLSLSNNNLSEIDLSGLSNLRSLYVDNNNLQYIDVMGLNSLENIWCQNNPMLFINTPSSVTNISAGNNGNNCCLYLNDIDLSEAITHGMDLNRISDIYGATLIDNKLVRRDSPEYILYYYLPHPDFAYPIPYKFYDNNCAAEFDIESLALSTGESKTIIIKEKGNFHAIGQVVSENEDILIVDWKREVDNENNYIVPVTITRIAPGDCHVIIKDFGSIMRNGDTLLVTDATGISDIDGENNTSEHNSSVYDIMGRPTTLPLKPGIYIRNGKKFIVGASVK